MNSPLHHIHRADTDVRSFTAGRVYGKGLDDDPQIEIDVKKLNVTHIDAGQHHAIDKHTAKSEVASTADVGILTNELGRSNEEVVEQYLGPSVAPHLGKTTSDAERMIHVQGPDGIASLWPGDVLDSQMVLVVCIDYVVVKIGSTLSLNATHVAAAEVLLHVRR